MNKRTPPPTIEQQEKAQHAEKTARREQRDTDRREASGNVTNPETTPTQADHGFPAPGGSVDRTKTPENPSLPADYVEKLAEANDEKLAAETEGKFPATEPQA